LDISMKFLIPAMTFAWLALSSLACDDGAQEHHPSRIAPLGFELVVDASQASALSVAASDLVQAWVTIKGLDPSDEAIRTSLEYAVAPELVVVKVEPDALGELGEQGFSISALDFGRGRAGLEVRAATDTGAAYGLYDIAAELGVRYFHPKDTFFPSNPALTLPTTHYDGTAQKPSFALRGFHHHTQHPIPMSDFLLRPEGDGFRDEVSRELRWLLRNRQNALSFQLLKGVDLATWLPYIASISEEARGLGIQLGVVTSFADQQQNNYKLIDDERPEDEQIRERLELLTQGGFSFITLQLGTSEFTKPTDLQALQWIETASATLADHHPDVELNIWIHTTCSLKADDGSYYYHLPQRSNSSVGAWVHTVMFHNLEDPAPVYDCDNFVQQQDFLREESGRRALSYFPETAWWLGFDNNLPLSLPITGTSRAHDIQDLLPDYDVSGHITFTTGREWNYWQYDHYLTRATWDRSISWEDYLQWIEPMYGVDGDSVYTLLQGWTEQQVKDFFKEAPLIYFTLAGELPQDEVGERAGILARRPKRSYRSVLEMDDTTFAAWQTDELQRLRDMRATYAALLDQFPATAAGASSQSTGLMKEVRVVSQVYVRRLEQAIELYEAVVEARTWAVEQQNPTPDLAVRERAQVAANLHLEAARAISAAVEVELRDMEANYRYPVELLARMKPESLTSYPYGYLEQTSTAYFWHRRDDQLESFLARVFDESNDTWLTEPDLLFYTNASSTRLTAPDDPVAGSVIVSFVPQLLFGLLDYDAAAGTMSLLVAQDFNENFLPDEGLSEIRVDGALDGLGGWSGDVGVFSLTVRDTSEVLLGTLDVQNAHFTLELVVDGALPSDLGKGTLSGQVPSAGLLAIILAVPGIDVEGATNLLKQIYEVPVEDPLPELLEVAFLFSFKRAEP